MKYNFLKRATTSGFFLIISLFLFMLFMSSCNEAIEEEICSEVIWYLDADSDGLGDPNSSISSCDQPEGFVSNANDEDDSSQQNDEEPTNVLEAIIQFFAGVIDPDNLQNYENQPVPNYIQEDNTEGNLITDEGATLGRVLFYDKNLSIDNTVSCASCHKQEFAFGDDAQLSEGVNGVTGRHSMRLVNARFSDEERFFWDERANTLEEQTTLPIQDHVEMGFSGENGDPDINDLITKLDTLDYYQGLFTMAFGDSEITEERMQNAMAQFVRSIQSFDSRFDEGLAQVNNINQDFPNFTAVENQGKTLYMTAPNDGGAGCQTCHGAPEFDIDDDSDNNGVIGVAGDPNAIDLDVTRSPTLRDLFNSEGQLNGPLMHDGSFTSFEAVLAHYNDISVDPRNDNLDNRLRGGRGGNGQNLNLDDEEVEAIVAFVKTLSGSDVYTNEKWSDPFQD